MGMSGKMACGSGWRDGMAMGCVVDEYVRDGCRRLHPGRRKGERHGNAKSVTAEGVPAVAASVGRERREGEVSSARTRRAAQPAATLGHWKRDGGGSAGKLERKADRD